MELTQKNKDYINAMSYQELLQQWRFAFDGNEWFQDETGKYWGKRMAQLKEQDPDEAVRASKSLGW